MLLVENGDLTCIVQTGQTPNLKQSSPFGTGNTGVCHHTGPVTFKVWYTPMRMSSLAWQRMLQSFWPCRHGQSLMIYFLHMYYFVWKESGQGWITFLSVFWLTFIHVQKGQERWKTQVKFSSYKRTSPIS